MLESEEGGWGMHYDDESPHKDSGTRNVFVYVCVRTSETAQPQG